MQLRCIVMSELQLVIPFDVEIAFPPLWWKPFGSISGGDGEQLDPNPLIKPVGRSEINPMHWP